MNSPKPHPPKWALRFLRWYCREDFLDEIEGDLWELYESRAVTNPSAARRFFAWNVLRSFRLVNIKKAKLNNWTTTMVKNYTKIYFRRFRRETAHYLVNILGLSLGFSVLFFILLFVYDEQNIDHFHSKKDRIYRVVVEMTNDGETERILSTPAPLAKALKEEYPAIEQTAHLTYWGSQVLVKGEIRLADRNWAIATPELFDILDIPIVAGDPKKEVNGEAGLVVTEGLAMRLFGKTDVVGEVVDDSNHGAIEVIAVMQEMPRNSSYAFNNIYVTRYQQWGENWERLISSWEGRFTQTWVLLKEGTSPKELMASQGDFKDKYLPEDIRNQVDFKLQNIQDIHLGSEGIIAGGMNPIMAIPYSSREFVSMILMLGFLVIFIATLNYVNLSSVQALKRTLEASMRKINGAANRQLLYQLSYETLLTVVLGYVLSLAITWILFPFFLEIAHKDFTLGILFSEDFLIYHVAIVLVIWMISAVLPAIYYSQLKRSLLVLKNAFSGKGDTLRKGLVGIQYALSIFLIIGSLVIYRQLHFVQDKDLGFDKDQMIVLDINSGAARRSFQQIVDGIRQHAHVVNVSASSRVPGEWKNLPSARLASTLTEEPITVNHYGADRYWLDTYQMKLKSGVNFSGNSQVDSLHILINSKTADLLGLEHPLEESIWVMSNRDSVRMQIIGIVEDFHFKSMYEPIGPLVITSWNNHVRSLDYFTIRYDNNPQEVLAHIEKVNATYDPETPPEINFLDAQWNRYYVAEESRASIMLVASLLSILISAFGLFGLINFTVERKTKEIGIRKVMGASVGQILNLILKDYMVLLLISLVIAAPIAWWVFSSWLAEFAYRIAITPDLYMIAFGIVLLISLVTLVFRIRAVANTDPVKAIRYE